MDIFSPAERLARVFEKKEADRPPVICPGGMMNSAVVDIMEKTGNTLPAAHHSWELMSSLAGDVYEQTGFENFGVPFCMTVEAEVLGSEINYGSLECEPKIQKEAFSSALEAKFLPPGSMGKNKRVGAVVQTIYNLSQKYPDIPAIGSLTGPLSTGGSLIDPMTFLKQLRSKSEASHRFLDYVCENLIEYAMLMADNGAAAISIADPTSTGEILGPKMFKEYSVPYLNKIADAIHKRGIPVIIHICGKITAISSQLPDLHGDAISVDAFVNLKNIKAEHPGITTMGNLSTYLLQFGEPGKIMHAADTLLNDKIDIISPACGLSTATPLENIRAFTGEIKER